MGAIGTSTRRAGVLVVCLVIVLASGALANGGSGLGSASDTLTKQGASGQTYVWQSGSC